MKTPPISLKEVFEVMIIDSLAAELKYSKLFEQFSTLTATAELGTLLSPDKNEFDQQIERLKLIVKQLVLRAIRECSDVDEVFLKLGKDICGYKKQRSGFKDVQILALAKQITFHRIAVFGTLAAIAAELHVDPAGLLNQTVEEIRNTAAYINQIEQNILYPSLKG